MDPRNQTQFIEFIFLAFSEKPEQQGPLFGLFLSMYLVTVVGNLLIMLAIGSDSHLHTPHVLLSFQFVHCGYLCGIHYSFQDVDEHLDTRQGHILCRLSYPDVLLSGFCRLDNFLLTTMAYDHFVAICHPLRYSVIISPGVCSLLVLLSWIISFLHSLLHCLMVTRLSFCTDHEIQHFFCDLAEVLKLSCSDTLINYVLIYFVTGLLAILPLTGILFSYTQICTSILKIPSAHGKYKAFSTCGSHLSVVFLFYGTDFGVYFSSSATLSSWKSTAVSVMFTVVTPMLNSFIYTLRNKDIKDALKKLISRIISSQ